MDPLSSRHTGRTSDVPGARILEAANPDAQGLTTGGLDGIKELYQPRACLVPKPRWRFTDSFGKPLKSRGLSQATIGTDLQFIQKDSLNWLKEAYPHCTFVDMASALYVLRAIIDPRGIELLRRAAQLHEARPQ